MRRYLLTILFALIFATGFGQSRSEAMREYQNKRRQAYGEYVSNYRKAFSDYMRKRWEAFESNAPVSLPERKEPDNPVVKPSDDDNLAATPDDKKPVDDKPAAPAAPTAPAPSTPAPKPAPTPAPTPAPVVPAKPSVATNLPYKFTFYGTECSVTLASSQKFRLSSSKENDVATAWERISSGSYDKAAEDCNRIADALKLNDWGYYRLVQVIADGFCGKGSNESVLLQSFLLAEKGLMVRLARSTDNRLLLLLSSDCQLFGYPYLTIDKHNFYIFEKKFSGSCAICNFKIPGERAMAMNIKTLPNLTMKNAPALTREFKRENFSTTVSVNANVIAYLNDYPACDWSYYASAPLSEQTKAQLYPTLRKALEGKDETGKVKLLLQYLHAAFPYMTDNKQFGHERTFFAEEMYYYPYSDCEDRAILFARLVEDLTGLNTVLLYYPNHIASAVRFTGSVSGDSVTVDGKRYTICDPTYIGANIGEAMPEFKNTKPQIIKIDK